MAVEVAVNDDSAFNRIAFTVADGVGFHSDLADAFLKMGLIGFSMMQESRFSDEARGLRELHRWMVENFGECSAMCVNEVQGKPTDVREAFNDWVNWEQKVHDEYETAIGSVEGEHSKSKLEEMLESQRKELDFAMKLRGKLESVEYDPVAIAEIQPQLEEHYREVLENGNYSE